MLAAPVELVREHVLESNLIEDISAGPGSPEYDDHVVAARCVVEGNLVDPNHLHWLLGRRIPDLAPFAGRYCPAGYQVWVGSRKMPRREFVPALMEHWHGYVKRKYLEDERATEASAFLFHAWLLCIHPWADGNGRTSRLVWNMLRLQKGMPWHIEPAGLKQFFYYPRIQKFEDEVFKKWYPDVY